jgi:DNA-binding GntR family transcriptional regulator
MLEEEKISLASEKKELLSERIHDEILELIIKNAADEEMVLNEKRLMELFGVSKAPIREALIKLCSEGVLRNIPRYGYVVVRLREKDAREVMRMRQLLEQEALREGFEQVVQYHLPEIQKKLEETERQKEERENAGGEHMDVWQVWEDNEEFHLLLASYAGNQLILRFLKECLGIQKRVYAQFSWNRRRSLDDSIDKQPHMGIYKALQERDLDKALKLLGEDIMSTI